MERLLREPRAAGMNPRLPAFCTDLCIEFPPIGLDGGVTLRRMGVQILGVSGDATEADIRKAYKKAVLKYHPVGWKSESARLP